MLTIASVSGIITGERGSHLYTPELGFINLGALTVLILPQS